MNTVRSIVNAWDCCGTCAGGVLAGHDAAVRSQTRDELLAELEALEAERDCLVLELDRVRAELDGNGP